MLPQVALYQADTFIDNGGNIPCGQQQIHTAIKLDIQEQAAVALRDSLT